MITSRQNFDGEPDEPPEIENYISKMIQENISQNIKNLTYIYKQYMSQPSFWANLFVKNEENPQTSTNVYWEEVSDHNDYKNIISELVQKVNE